MYSSTKGATKFQTFVAGVLIAASVFFFTPPKDADALVTLLILGSLTTVTVGTVIAGLIIDGIILCVAGVICGSGGGGGGGGGSCDAVAGATCQSETNSCGDFNTGVIECNGFCSVGPPSDMTNLPCGGNYCGLGAGTQRCDYATTGQCFNETNVPDDQCVGLPLPSDALVITPTGASLGTPALVRIEDTVDISWNLGQNWPPNCTLTGPNISQVFTGPADATGTIVGALVNGPHRYTLECGGAPVTADVKILPEIRDS